VQRDAIQDVGQPAESCFGGFEGDTAHQAVNFIAETQQVIGQVTAVLSGNTGYKSSFGHGVI
jgi:hypothetical protein